jgi:transaldolase
MLQNPLLRLHELGQSVWLDLVSRKLVRSGELQQLIADDGLRGVTSNPTIFDKAIGGSQDYDESIRRTARAGKNSAEIYQVLMVEDLRGAADLFRPAFDREDGRDGFVSMEVSPHLAHDTAGTLEEARRFWQALDRPNAMIKVPATEEGIPAIRQLTSEGINVNITLLFGLPRYRQVVDAYISGLEELAARGRPLSRIASVASFFLSRIDVLLDPKIEKFVGDPFDGQEAAPGSGDGHRADLARELRGQVAIASAKLAYEIYQEMFGSERWQKLARQGARTQRLLWASTGTKNPAYSDVKYVEPLIGRDTINTMPMETIDAYRDHGRPALTLGDGLEAAHEVLERLAEAGIDIDKATRQLEDEGAEKFNASYDHLMKTIDERRVAVASR